MQKCLRYFRAEDDPRVYAVNSQVSGDIVIYTAVGYGTISARPAITFTATEQPFGQHQIILLGDWATYWQTDRQKQIVCMCERIGISH